VYSPAGSVPLPSHLLSYIPTKPNLNFDSSSDTVTSEPVLYELLTFQVPYLISIFRRLGCIFKNICPSSRLLCIFHNMLIFYGEGLLAQRPTPKLEDHPCCLSTASYSIHLQPHSIAGGHPFIHNLSMRHAVVTRNSPNMDTNNIQIM
jgi:hypothetical protein